jgi:hypothetical protein
MRLFYLAFPIRHALRDEFGGDEKVKAFGSELPGWRELERQRRLIETHRSAGKPG